MPSKDVFLSYASEDRDRICPLVRALEDTGWSVFWDRAIPAGKTWRDVLEEEITTCRAVVVAWSERAVRSSWVSEEANEGKRRNILIPVRIDAVDPPFGFREMQAIDLVRWDGLRSAPPFRRLVDDLSAVLSAPPSVPSSPPPRKAKVVWKLLAGLASIIALGWGYLTVVRQRGELTPLTTFRDCKQCPEMVVMPAGEFRMGSLESDPGRVPEEVRPHTVVIADPFAVGKYEVTFAEWDACVTGGGCSHTPDDGGWGHGRQPVINVDWDDARAYASWLSRKTGKPYRLLSEAEWEYAARAGATTRYPWGDDPGNNLANFVGSGSRWSGQRPAPADSFTANAFGLHNMIGNVLEWVQDCLDHRPEAAPADGRPWESGDCGNRLVRGGSWYGGFENARTSVRSWAVPGLRVNYVGIRVARTLFLPGSP